MDLLYKTLTFNFMDKSFFSINLIDPLYVTEIEKTGYIMCDLYSNIAFCLLETQKNKPSLQPPQVMKRKTAF